MFAVNISITWKNGLEKSFTIYNIEDPGPLLDKMDRFTSGKDWSLDLIVGETAGNVSRRIVVKRWKILSVETSVVEDTQQT